MPRKVAIKETSWKLPTKDGATIYGVSDTARGNKAAVVFVHGLTGHMHEHFYQSAVPRFVSEGYDCIRFDQYGAEPNARRLRDCIISTHAMDLELVIDKKAKDYKKLFVVGHSLGAPVSMRCNHPRVTAYCLWDATYDHVSVGWGSELKKTGNDYLNDWGVEHVIGHRMVKDDINYDRAHCRAMAKASHAPIQVVTAGEGAYARRKESWNTYGPKGSRRVFIKRADHCFTPLGTADRLHEVTLDWFKRFK